ncbi:MAG: 50S ribosomal protein L32e, partial [Methanomassiliicoccaceae archaeon]|nr:50S ribosomal protein L32e [Methanomassiliicoccaceae archaeon]
MSVKSLTDLSGLKEKHLEELAKLGIKNVADMKKALASEAKVKEMIKTLSGIGPKTVDKWRTELEGVDVKEPAKDAKK